MSDNPETPINRDEFLRYQEGIKEAWAIINVFNMTALDEGVAYCRATFWLDNWESVGRRFPMECHITEAPDYSGQPNKIKYED